MSDVKPLTAKKKQGGAIAISPKSPLFTHALAFFVGVYIYSCFLLNSKMNVGIIMNRDDNLFGAKGGLRPSSNGTAPPAPENAAPRASATAILVESKTDEQIEIPKVIHIVGKMWLKENDSWKKLNPDYTVESYNDKRCEKFVMEHYPQYEFVYNHLKSVRRFDFVRYLIVYHYGGIYADSVSYHMQPHHVRFHCCHFPSNPLLQLSTTSIHNACAYAFCSRPAALLDRPLKRHILLRRTSHAYNQ